MTRRSDWVLWAVTVTLILGVVSRPSGAQEVLLWQQKLSAKVEQFGYSASGALLVQLEAGLQAIDPQSGKQLWTRPEATSYEMVTGTPYGVIDTAEGRIVVNLESGQDRWKLAALGFSTVKGIVHLPLRELVLVYGETLESGHTIVAANNASGEVRWKQADVFPGAGRTSKARKVKYTRWLLDTDDSIVLDPTEEGLVKLDLRSGKVIWRASETELGGEDNFEALYAADGRIYGAYGKKLLAVDAGSGQLLWRQEDNFRSPVAQMASTPRGLLVRGAYNVDGKGRTSWRPYLILLDPMTGAIKWTTEKTEFHGRSSFLIEQDRIVVAVEEGLATHDLVSGAVLTTTRMSKFGGGENACCIQRLEDGRLLVWSSQNIRMLDKAGTLIYSVFLKAPGASFLSKLASTALLAAAGAASYAATAPGGIYFVPTRNPLLTARYSATVDAERFMFIFTEADAANVSAPKFSLVRIDKETGKETGRLLFTDRSPRFELDPATGIAVVLKDNALLARRFAPAN